MHLRPKTNPCVRRDFPPCWGLHIFFRKRSYTDNTSSGSKIEKAQTTIEQKVHEAINRVRKDYEPLAKAGVLYRNDILGIPGPRSREPGPVIIDDQDQYDGMALADASMYQSFCPMRRIDTETYKAWYGVDPFFVWKNRASSTFLQVLDLGGAVKEIIADNGLRLKHPKNIQDSLRLLTDKIEAFPSTWNVETLNNYLLQNDSKNYNQMWNEYQATLKSWERLPDAPDYYDY